MVLEIPAPAAEGTRVGILSIPVRDDFEQKQGMKRETIRSHLPPLMENTATVLQNEYAHTLEGEGG